MKKIVVLGLFCMALLLLSSCNQKGKAISGRKGENFGSSQMLGSVHHDKNFGSSLMNFPLTVLQKYKNRA